MKLPCFKKESITYIQAFIQVEGLGSHNIVDIGTVQYTVIDDDSHTINLILKNILYVPMLDVQ